MKSVSGRRRPCVEDLGSEGALGLAANTIKHAIATNEDAILYNGGAGMEEPLILWHGTAGQDFKTGLGSQHHAMALSRKDVDTIIGHYGRGIDLSR